MKISAMWMLIPALLFWSCGDEETPGGNPSGGSGSGATENWLIPENSVFDGGPGKDGIPAISNPRFAPTGSTTYLDDAELVIGFKNGNIARAYPHQILDWHEIVNDEIDDKAFALTYCPLTGTAVNWNRTIKGFITTFGVSGLLYNSNLIPYDRETDSNWSQMELKCVNGPLIGTEASTYQVVETTWKTWKEMFPDSEVMTLETGFERNYGRYPYINQNGDYRTEDYLIFPVTNSDSRLDPKERVHGIIVNGQVRVYRFDEFEDEAMALVDVIGSSKVVVIGSQADNFIVSFEIGDQEISIVQSGESLFKDQNENQYNVFGEIISGPDEGSRLVPTQSFMGYWFSWAAFFPNVEIFTP